MFNPRISFAGISENCTFCNRFRETTEHLLWSCDNVIEFRNEIRENLSQEVAFLNLVSNTPKDRILGYCYRGSDNFEFIFYMYVNRYIWLTKLKEGNLSILAFKNYLGQCLKIQKAAGVLTCLELIHINHLWI